MSHVMPAFVFARKREIEVETGLTLAGFLIVDLPKGKKPKGRDRRMIAEVIEALTTAVKSGRMPDDAITCRNGREPKCRSRFGSVGIMMTAYASAQLICGGCFHTELGAMGAGGMKDEDELRERFRCECGHQWQREMYAGLVQVGCPACGHEHLTKLGKALIDAGIVPTWH
jgi:hypothetical protein